MVVTLIINTVHPIIGINMGMVFKISSAKLTNFMLDSAKQTVKAIDEIRF